MNVNTKRIEDIFTIFARHNLHPVSDLQFSDSFTLLIAVVLSARCTDKQVNRVMPGLLGYVKDVHGLAQCYESELYPFLQSLGLYRVKTKYIIQLARQLIHRHKGQVPKERGLLEKLSGVGRKTAGVVLNIAFGCNEIPVDTHVYRVSHRLDLSQGKTPHDVEQDLHRVIPEQYKHRAHHDLLLHGRYTCYARNPQCKNCILFQHCFQKQSFL